MYVRMLVHDSTQTSCSCARSAGQGPAGPIICSAIGRMHNVIMMSYTRFVLGEMRMVKSNNVQNIIFIILQAEL